jgi:hypothetical protein
MLASTPQATTTSCGSNSRKDGEDDPVERVEVAGVADASRQVHVRPGGVALADRPDRARLHREAAILMQGDREHRRIRREDRLRAVAVVRIDVDDRDAPEPILLSRR